MLRGFLEKMVKAERWRDSSGKPMTVKEALTIAKKDTVQLRLLGMDSGINSVIQVDSPALLAPHAVAPAWLS